MEYNVWDGQSHDSTTFELSDFGQVAYPLLWRKSEILLLLQAQLAATFSWTLAEDMRLLTQRQKILLLVAKQ
jgi:hypothetical protein